MNPNRKQLLLNVVNLIMVLSVVFNLVLPAADLIVQAQEATQEPIPAEIATDVPTDEPTATQPPTEAPTDVPTEVSPIAPTDVPTDAATTEATEVVTSEPTAVPTVEITQPPVISVFQDDFQDANFDGWLLTPGWQLGVEGENLFLTTANPNESAAIANLSLADFSFAARVRITDFDHVDFAFRAGTESYVVTLDALGNVNLSRGGVLLAQGTLIAPPADGVVAPVWHTLNVQALGGLLTVSVDGEAQISFTDPAPLPAGGITISSDTFNTGAVSLDQIIIGQPQPIVVVPVETPVPLPTAAPTEDATVAPPPTEEITPEATVEATSEATVEALPTEEVTPEATPTEEQPALGQVVLSADFESELIGWLAGEGTSVVVESEGNQALLMAAGATLLPSDTLYLADFQVDTRFNITSDAQDGSATGFGFAFRTQDGQGYVLSVEGTQTVLYRNDASGLVPLATSATVHDLNVWHTLRLDADGGHFVVTVDGVVEVDFTDAEPLTNGQIAFAANAGSSIMLDDIIVTDFTPVDVQVTVTPTALVAGLTDEERAKLTDVLGNVVDAYAQGDESGALDLATANFLPMDEQGRVSVMVWAAEGLTGQDVAPIVQAVGGEVDFVNDYSVQTRVPLGSFVALVNAPQVFLVDITSQAVSTGNAEAPAEAPAGNVLSEGYDVIGTNDWHLAGLTGSGSKIAIIDTGFSGVSSGGEWACLSGTAPTGSTHGNMVLQVVCDIVPGAAVKLYKATDAATLASKIDDAVTDGNQVILITMDLGVDVGPGDGIGLGGSAEDVYTAIDNARNTSNRLVVVSAGNNNGRQVNFNYATGGTTTISITVNAGDHINVSWDDWGPGATGKDLNMTLSGSGIAAQNYTVNRPAGGATPPSKQFTVPNQGTCDDAPAALCTLTLTINSSSASGYVQVQATGVGAVNNPGGSGASNVNTTSTIGRPGDSPDALTVGAVCTYKFPYEHFPLLAGSSHGPVFGSGGSAPAAGPFNARNAFKPDLVGPSEVSTSFDANGDGGIDSLGLCDDTDTDGFTGTSAAAAHVAAMAALIRTDANISVTTPDAIVDYMQSHSVDLYEANGIKPDGFDMSYGSGLAVLGNPNPPEVIATDPATLPNGSATCASGSILYVSPFNLSAERNLSTGSLGTWTNPYIHPAQAVANAQIGDCVVLLPGEYVGDIYIDNNTSKDGVSLRSFESLVPTGLNSIFWVNNDIQPDAGIAVGSVNSPSTIDFTISGFQFYPGHPLGSRIVGGITYPSHIYNTNFNAVAVSYSTGHVVIDNSTFAGFPNSPVIISNSQDATIQNSRFSGQDLVFGAAITIQESGSTNPIVVQYNTFTDNTLVQPAATFYGFPLIWLQNAAANIFNNRIFNNFQTTSRRGTIITVQNSNDPNTLPLFTGSLPVQVVGNAIFNNYNIGPVVYLGPGRRFRFVNNTVAHQTSLEAGAKAIIQRSFTGEPVTGNGALEINNNVFFDNGHSETDPVEAIFDDFGPNTACYDFNGNADSGMKNNWSWDSGGVTADCVNSLAGFNNRIDDPLYDPTNDFIVNFQPGVYDDPYQLIGTSDGIDYGNDSYVTGIITTDVLKHDRFNGQVDVGAYEFKTVGGTDFAISIPEDTNSVPIAMDQYVSGGFAPYSLEILGFPQNYATDTENACGGQPLALSYNSTTKKNTITYCPPPNFYNNTGTPPEAAVSFTYLVHDSFGSVADTSNVATITVTKVADAALSTPIPTYTILTQADTPISFRLRPYAKFSNFRFSESGNEADYPFTYSAPSIVTTGLPNENLKLLDTNNNSSSQDEINAAVAAVSSSGLITVTPKTGEVGFIEFTYTIMDDPATNTANDTTTGTVIIRVVGSIPDNGLHDDTSFAFDYHGATNSDPGLWIPVYSEPNINNTLHNTSTVNDTAEFLMTGAGFALYMQGNKAGGKWELQLDNGGSSVPFNWTLNPITKRYNSSAGGVTCTTSGTSAAGTLISNLTSVTYVVSCNGLLEDQANTIRIINKENKLLSIDALGIVRDSSPLLNGFHEVTEKQVIPIFYGWTPLTDTKASGQRAMVTTNTNIPDVTFKFKGTGFAIGTVLEKYTTATTGTKYDICVAKAITPALKVCQSFDNRDGAVTAATYNVFRPFFGFDPDVEYEVTLNVTAIPTGGRMYVDSIVIFNQEPTAALSIGTTEDDDLGSIVFGGGKEDTWSLNTVFTKASNGSLTSVNKGVPFAGPFVSFRIPDTANTINWYRYAGITDSSMMLICVDRSQGDIAGDQSTHCVTKDLKLAGTPVIIKEDEFDYNGPSVAGTGWGSAWGLDNTHTVEIFSLTNFPFNVDKIQVVNSGDQLTPGHYEENVPGIRYFTENGGTYTLDAPGGSGNFTDVVNTKSSSGKYKLLNSDSSAAGADTLNLNEGMFFQFSGTGFSTYFTMDRKSDAVRICWKNNIYGNNPDGTSVNDVLTTGACQTFDNESSVAQYQAARTVVGLPFADYSVVVQMLPDQAEPVAHISTYLPITMGIDAVQVYNHNPMPGNVLDTLGTRYETSFVNQSADDTFIYLGKTWKSVSGKSAALYSGQNYDSITASVGAGVVFSTDGTAGSADSLIIYRGMTTKSAALQVCVNGATITNRTCTIINTNGGVGYQQPIVVPLGSTGAHIVSVITMDAGAFALDAFELGKKSTLTAGIYNENDPALVYSNTTNLLKPIRSQWKDIPLKSYSDGGAMQSILDGASVTFNFTGTGFSLISQFDTLSGTLDVDIDGTTTNDYLNRVFDSYSSVIIYGSSHSITGLPLDTYTVTITESHATRNRFTVDGVEIYNTSASTAMGAGIYDDPTVDGSDAPYINYGPNNGSWVLKSGAGAPTNLNKTSHLASRYGAEATFNVTGANLVTLFDVGTNSPHLRVCAKEVGSANGSATWFCNTTTVLSTRGNLTISLDGSTGSGIDIPLSAGGPGDYAISVTMLDHKKNLYIDAVGVYPAAQPLPAGLYQDNHPFFNTSVTGTWLAGSTAEAAATDKFVKSTGTGNSGDAFTFQFTGTGFSIVLVQSTATSTTYTLCVQTGGSCDIINQPLVPVGATSAKKPVALTYVGFTNATYTVKITNNDSSKPLLLDRVDILGTVSQQIASTVTGNVENTDSRITYFPYFSFTSAAAPAASGGSQHTGTIQGSIIYFELNGFAGDSIDYVRQTATSYGAVGICSGALGTNSSGCAATTVNNNTAPIGYLQAANVPVTTGTKWVAIRSLDTKVVPFDFVRPVAAAQTLTAGLFEEDHPSLRYFTENGGIYSLQPVNGNSGNFVDVVNAAASAGSLRLLSADVGTPGNGLSEGMLFQFNGTGFGVKFMLDKYADAVKICWVNSLSTNVATVLGGTCQLFDNQSNTPRNQAERVIHGLPSGDHTVVVQMQADNLQPTAHIATSLPLTMNLDAVQVFGDDWTSLDQLTVGTRYETSFVNTVADNQFIYVGTGWKSVSGKTAAQNSGSDYDQITNVIGAGVVFRTTGGNTITLYRNTGSGYAPVIVCAAPTGDQTKRYCTLVQNNGVAAKQAGVQVFLNDPNSPGAGLGQVDDTSAHVVSIMTLDYGTFILDAVEVINASSSAAMVPGFYEDNYPALAYSNPNLTGSETVWASVSNKIYTDGRIHQTSDNDAELIFHVTGATGFAIGTVEDRFGGEVEVCYNSNNNTGFPAGAATRCFTYEDERSATSNNVSRTVTGLTTGSTYAVRVRGVEDGTSVLTNAPRLAGYTPSRMRIDYVQVFGGALPTVVPAGYYDEDAVDGGGLPYLQLLPTASWFSFTGNAAKGFTYSSYAGVVDTKNKVSALYAGPVATLRVTIPSGAGADGASTVVLYTGAANISNTDKLLVCANGVHGSEVTPAPDCTIITNLRTTNHILLTESVLSALGADGTTVTLSFRALTPGYFRIDGFQVISGTTLVAGIYDDFLFAPAGLIDAANVGGTGLWTITPTTGTVSAKAFGGTIALAKSTAGAADDPTLNFKFSGTGFSIITQADVYGADMRICYKLTSSAELFPALNTVLEQEGNLNGGDVLCHTRSTDTTVADWRRRNGGEPLLATAYQYGFDVHGLPSDDYTVEVRLIDTTLGASDRLKIDAVAVFGSTSGSPLTPGTVYDDREVNMTLSQGFSWNSVVGKSTPPKGQWQATETNTSAVGAIAQLSVTGNALVLYQTASAKGSNYALLCITTSVGQDCTQFSQNSRVTKYFTPIVFYGLGGGTHDIVIENRAPGKFLSIDAIRILP